MVPARAVPKRTGNQSRGGDALCRPVLCRNAQATSHTVVTLCAGQWRARMRRRPAATALAVAQQPPLDAPGIDVAWKPPCLASSRPQGVPLLWKDPGLRECPLQWQSASVAADKVAQQPLLSPFERKARWRSPGEAATTAAAAWFEIAVARRPRMSRCRITEVTRYRVVIGVTIVGSCLQRLVALCHSCQKAQ